MALKDPKRGGSRELPERRTAIDDASALMTHVRENPIIAAAIAGCLLLVIAVGVLFIVSQKASVMEANTDLAAAITNEDPALRAEALETVAATRSHNDDMALYLAGEAAIRAKKYGEARSNFEELLEKNPDSDYAARSAEALAFLQENDGDLEGAVEAYRGVIQKYPGSFTAQTLYTRIGQVLEKLDRPKEAIEAYMEQWRAFPQGRVTVTAMSNIRNLKDSTAEEVAEAAATAFGTLSEESPLFQQEFPYYYVAPEEPEAALEASDDSGPMANTGAITVTPLEETAEAPAPESTPSAPAE